MKEKKENIFKKLKQKWDELDRQSKGVFIGSFLGSFVTAFGGSMIYNHREKVMADAAADMCKQKSYESYSKGLKDGQIQAYYELLTKPETAFKKMGFKDKDIVKF